MRNFADCGLTAEVIDRELKPGWVFTPVGSSGLAVAVTPWPEYRDDGGPPVWLVKVVRPFDGRNPTRRYWLKWSSRLGRWAQGKEWARLAEAVGPGVLRELDCHMRDTLEGSLV